MKTASPALVAFLNGFRPTADAPLCMADLFTITLASGSVAGIASGTVLTYTDKDVAVAWGGYTYAKTGPQLSGLKYKGSLGVNVDSQRMTIAAWPADVIGGVPFLQAVQQGLFDGAEIQRERAFFVTDRAPSPIVPIGTVLLFKGRVTSIDNVGRTTAEITVASDLTLLSIDMPRNIFSPSCNNVLYGAACGVSRASRTSIGAVGSGSTMTEIFWSGATSHFQQGALTFTSGANSGVEATIKSAAAGWLQLAYPLPDTPEPGDAFSAAWGCDHSMGAQGCAQFSNLANFRGFPYVPPPQIVTGPLATYTPITGKAAKI